MQFRLRTPHVIEGAVRNAGTIVGPYGSGAPVVLAGDPSPDMEGLDEEAVAKVNEVYRQLHGVDAPWHSENAPGAPERPYNEDHPDYAEINPDEQNRLNQELAEANAKHHYAHGTAPAQTIPPAGAAQTAVRPMTAETPQNQATRPDRPLGQQLPDAMPSAASTSPNQEQAKTAAVEAGKADAAQASRDAAAAYRHPTPSTTKTDYEDEC